MFFKANYRRFFLKNYPIVILLLLEAILFVFNYKSGAWLLGWDNTVPEFNFPLSFKRNLFAVWQEYRGLGLLDGMAHAANTVHTLFLWFLSIFIPFNLLRYFFTFLMHFLGGLGVYFLILNIKNEKPVLPTGGSKIAGLIGSLFYLLNIGTIQMFYVPLEVFSVHFVALPWLSLFLLKFLKEGRKKDLGWFFAVSLLCTPQSFVPTVFVVYFLSFLVFLLFNFHFKRAVLAFSVLLAVNAFWALPYLFGVFSNANVISSSKINQMANEEILQKNKAFGDFKSVALIKGFSLDYIDSQTRSVSNYMMKPWREHIERPELQAISWLFFGLAIMGIFKAIKSRQKETYLFLVLFAASFLMLANDVPVVSIPFNLLSEFIPFFSEVFRFVFTKFSLLYVFCYSIFLALGVEFLVIRVAKKAKWIVLAFLLGLIIYYSLPAFEGNFFYKNLKVMIPKEYFFLIDYFKKENENQRLMVLPQPDFWGWTYYDWGYRGSGFLWQALPQSDLDGAFLPWSAENENFYWQMSLALYSKDLPFLESILEKYGVNWLLVDENIVAAKSSKTLHLDKLEALIESSSKIEKVKQFDNIKVYKTNLQAPVKDFVFLARNLPEVGPEYRWNNEDTGFTDNGYYLSDRKSEVGNSELTYYPFRSLFTGRKQEELEFGVEDKGDYWAFRADLPEGLASQQLVVNQENEDELMYWNKNLESSLVMPEISIGSQLKLEVRWPKKKGFYSYDSFDDIEYLNKEVHSCNPFNTGVMKQGIVKEEDKTWLRFESVGSSNCLDIDLPVLTHKTGYLVKIESRYIKGKQLVFSVINKDSKRNEIETYLPKLPATNSFFIIPPMEEYGQGYTLHFDNVSIGRQETINDLGRIEVYPIPYRLLKGLRIVSDSSGRDYYPFIDKNSFQVEHPNPSFYKISFNNTAIDQLNKDILVLSQAYHQGWVAFSLNFSMWKPFVYDHFLVNNWENGWQLNNSTMKQFNNETMTIYLFFWPQMLEYLGFGLLIGVGVWVVFRKDQ